MPVVAIIGAYLLGTFPSAVLVARANGVDIHRTGSGNPGASNVTRTLGWRKGAWVYVLDALKGAVATGLALAIDGRPLGYACAAAAVIGHTYPVFRGFRGGRGVATGSGALAVLHPLIAVVAVPVWWVVTRVTGTAALGSIAAMAVVPIGMVVKGSPLWEFVATGLVCCLILVRHADNLARLVRREEHSLSGS